MLSSVTIVDGDREEVVVINLDFVIRARTVMLDGKLLSFVTMTDGVEFYTKETRDFFIRRSKP
jgi:hypothetical protein